jgi:hypothetical protein
MDGHLSTQQLVENAADINEEAKNQEVVKKALLMQWTPNIHHLYSKKTRVEIAILLKLTLKNTQFSRIPKDVSLYICKFVAQ